MNEQENRRSFRVNESVYLKYEILSEEEFSAGIEHRNLTHGMSHSAQAALVDIEARLGEAMFLLNAEHAKVGRCMTLFNDKLNIVIGQLPALRETQESLTKSPPQTCDVGADGMVFSSNEQLAPDTKLHLQFLLASDNRYVETFCRVVRVTDSPDNNEKLPFGIAVEFLNLPPSQREILIQHMFSRESETLRMRRLELESD